MSIKLCTQQGCTKVQRAHGLCENHYRKSERIKTGSKPHNTLEGFANTAEQALKLGKTYYLNATERCLGCGTLGRWSKTRECMHCHPHKMGGV